MPSLGCGGALSSSTTAPAMGAGNTPPPLISDPLHTQLPSSRDWAGLPPDLISSIFHRSDPVQIMLGADKVCRSWRRAARYEPELWRRIDVHGYMELSHRKLADLNQVAVDAVLRSQGQCQEFTGGWASVSDGVLRFLGDQAPALRSLILISCGEKLTDQGFLEAIQMFPKLEELELTECWSVRHEQLFEGVSKACPRLKHLRHRHSFDYCACCSLPNADDSEAMAIATMQGICSLQLSKNNLTNQGLAAILDNCTHLESLDIQNCCNLIIDDALRAKCAHIKNLKLVPCDRRYEDYWDNSEPKPISECYTCIDYFENGRTERYRKGLRMTTNINDEEHMVVAVVRELCSLQLYRNDFTSQGLAAILVKFPHLEPSDIRNCHNIIMNNTISTSKILQGTEYYYPWIKTKILTIKLLRGEFNNSNKFDPVGLTCDFPDLNMNYVVGSKYTRKKMNQKDFKRVKRNFFCKECDQEKLHPCRPIMDCSTCLMLEYFAKSWDELGQVDSYSYYYDLSNGLDSHDEVDFHVHHNSWEELDQLEDYSYYGLDSHDEIDFQVHDKSLEELDLVDHSSYYYDPSNFQDSHEEINFQVHDKNLEELDLDDHSYYYDPSNCLDSHDEIDFHVHERMVGKRLRRYLKME